MAGPITISVLGDTRDLRSATRGAKGDLTGLGKSSGVMGKAVKAGFFAAAAGAAYGVKKLIDFTKAAAEDEAAQVKLAGTLKNTTHATDTQIAGVEKWITKQGQLLGVTDDELRPALQRMAEGTHSVAKAQDMVSLAMDVSAGTGKSLKSVTEALLRAQNGSIGGLSRYGIATKDAKGETLSLKEVTAGMADTFGGQATKAAHTAGGMYGRLSLILSETGEAIGGKLLPYATDLADWALEEGIPAAEKWWKSTADTRAELITTAGAIRDDLLPPLKTLGSAVGELVGFFAGLPGPVKSFGAEAAAAALIVPRLTGAIGAVQTKAGGMVTNLRGAETRTKALGSAARTAAGVGGMLALTKGVQETDRTLGTLETTAGGALLGFSVAGPWGAAIGGGIGLLGGLLKQTHKTSDGMSAAERETTRYADAIDGIAAASGRARRAEILRLLQEADVIPSARRLGIETNVLVAALEGNDKAVRKINASWKNHTGVVDSLSLGKVTGFLRDQGFALQQSEDDLADNRAALKKWDGKVNESAGKVGRANKDLGNLGNVNPNGKWLAAYTGDLDRAGTLGRDKTARNNLILRNETGKARADLTGFGDSIVNGLAGIATRANNSAATVGANIARGLSGGIADNAWQAVNAAGAMVTQAINEANRRGDIHSPSRKTRKTGHHLAEGLERGLTDHQKHVRKAARTLIDNVLDQLDAGVDRAKDKLDQLTAARAAYVGGIRDAARDTAKLSDLGKLEDNTQTAAGIKAGLTDRLNAIRNFTTKVNALIKLGLKGDALAQLLDAGVDSGTVTAEALLSGGKDAVADAVKLTDAVKDAATDLGKIGGKHFHDAGIKAQEGLLAGLVKDRKALDKAGRTLGVRLAKAIRAELRRGLGNYDPVTGRHNKPHNRSILGDVDTHARRVRLNDPAAGAGAGGRVTVTLTAEQLSAIQRGRAVQLDLDAYRAAGGRRRR